MITNIPTQPYHVAIKKYDDDGFVTRDNRSGLGLNTAYVRDDNNGNVLSIFIRTNGTPNTESWYQTIAGYTTRATLLAADPTEAQDVVTLNYFNNNVNTTFKTLFGNQSIKGTGNIDLYKHVITVSLNKLSTSSIAYDTGKIYITLYSSKNLKVDSYADFTTIVGDTFTENCNGYVAAANASKQILRFSNGYLTIIGATDGSAQEIGISNFATTWTDVVTTI